MSETIYVYATDTVWGIGGNINSKTVHSNIATIKNTQKNKPISILFSSIEDVFKYVNFDKTFNEKWLSELFTLEATLGIPKSWWQNNETLWIFENTDYVAIRLLSSKHIKDICNKEKAPIFTTSLNLSGEPPFTNLDQAKTFFENHVLTVSQDAQFVEESNNLSGHSSTIVFYEEDHFRIIRPGKLEKNVREHLELLSTKVL